MAKRPYATAFEDDEVLRMKLADEEGREPLQAKLLVLLPMSQCVRSLPDKTEVLTPHGSKKSEVARF
jgi:hypothetical protein